MEVRNKNADPDAKNLPAVVHPNVVVSPHPISAARGRRLFYVDFVPGESLLDYLDRTTLLPPECIRDNFVLSHNGKMVTFEDAEMIFPRSGDMVVIRARLHGGDGGSNPLMVVLMIAVIIASQGTAAAWVGMMTGTSMAVGSAVVLIGGMLLISALVPMKTPTFDESTPDPTYALSGSSNRSRPYEPLPVVFGTVRMYPDHAARPFTAYENNDQMLIQLFNFGLTNPAITEMKIGDAPLEDFIGVDYEISSGTTGAITKFPSNVDTLAGADLIANAGTWITRTSSADTTRLVCDVSGVSFFIGREEGLTWARVTLMAEFRVAGSADAWSPFFRTFGGLVSLIPLVINWNYTNTMDIVNGDKDVMRHSYHRPVPSGQYEVRMMLVDAADIVYYTQTCDYEGLNCVPTTRYSARGLNNGGMTQVLAWDQLKSYQPDTGDYTNQKRMALELRANSQLNGIIDSFNVMAAVTIPSWNGSAWVDAVSSNPADQFLALARGLTDASGRRVYGAGLPDTRIDIATIQDWADWCADKSLECNIVLTQKMTVIDMMNTIARIGRGVATWSNGLLGVIYDEANKSAVSMFGMSNIVHDSFTVNYVSNNQVDEVIVAFVNPDIGWKRDTVRVLVPGVTIPVNSVTIELPGLTDEAQAAKEANLIAAEQFYRRRIMTWETDIEGLTVQRGDVAILSHDMTQWDYSGRLVAGPTASQLTLDREIDWVAGSYIGVRHPDGTYEIVAVDAFVSPQVTISLSTPLSVIPDNDVNNDVCDYMWFYGPTATPGKLVKITDITPLSEDRVRIQATDEEDAYYLSESDSYTYIPPTDYTTDIPIISDLQLGETLIIVGSGFESRVDVSWNVEGEYGGAFIRAGDQDIALKDVGRTLDQHFSFKWPVNKTVEVEVTLHNKNYEMSDVSRATASLLLVGKMKLPADVTNFVVLQNGSVVVMKWSQVADVDLSGYDIRYGKRGDSSYEDATPLTSVTKGTNVTSADVPPGDWTIYIKAVDTSGNYSENATERDIVVVTDRDVIVSLPQSPFQLELGDTLSDNDSAGYAGIYHSGEMIDGTKEFTAEVFIMKDAIPKTTRFCTMNLRFSGVATEYCTVGFDTSTGEAVLLSANGTIASQDFEDAWRITISAIPTNTSNTGANIELYPAMGSGSTISTGNYDNTLTNSMQLFYPRLLDENGVPYGASDPLELSSGQWILTGVNASLSNDTQDGPIMITGGMTNFVAHHTGKLVPQSQEADSDDGALIWADDTVFEIFVNNPYQVCEYQAPQIDIDFDDDVRVWGEILSELGVGVTEGVANPKLYIDHRLTGETFDGYEEWSIGNVYGRYFTHKLELDTDVGLAVVTEFTPVVDQLEHTDSGTETLAAAWTTITFNNPFHAEPFVTAVAVTGGASSKFAAIDNITSTTFDLAVFNSSGTLTTGTVNWEARGI